MVSQAQRLRQQQKELRGEDLKGLSKTESLRLQQEALTKGVPKRRLLAIREQQERMRKAEASPEVKELKNLLTTQKTYLDNLKKQLADAVSQRAAKIAAKENHPGKSGRSTRRRLSDEANILNAKAQALRRVIPNVEKVISQIDTFRKKAVTAVFVGREDIAINMFKNAKEFANQVQSNSNQYVSAKVRERGRRIRYSRRRERQRERQRKAFRELKDLGFSWKEIRDIKKGETFSLTTIQAEQLSTRSQRVLGIDFKDSFKPSRTLPSGTIVFDKFGQGMSMRSDLARKPTLQEFLADIRKPSEFERVAGVDLLTINDTRTSVKQDSIPNVFSKVIDIDKRSRLNLTATPPPTDIKPEPLRVDLPLTTTERAKMFITSKIGDIVEFGEEAVKGIPDVVEKATQDIFKGVGGIDVDVSKLAETTGGMTLISGEEVLVDRAGKIIDVPEGVVEKVSDYQKLSFETKTNLDKEIKLEIQNYVDVKAPEINSKIEKETTRLTILVEKGKINVEEANSKLEQFRDRQVSNFEKDIKNKQEIIIKGKVKKAQEVFLPKANKIAKDVSKIVDKSNFVPSVITGVIVALPFIAAGPLGGVVGGGILVSDITKAGGIKEFTETALETPYTSGGMLLGGLGAGVAVAGARIGKATISRNKIINAIDRAEIVDVPGRTLTIEQAIKKFKIDKNSIPEIENWATHGVKLKEVNTKLKPSKSNIQDVKLLPKVSGQFLEAISTDGKVIGKISVGKVVLKQKGKTFSRDVLQQASGKIDETNANIFVRTVTAEPDIRKGWKNIEVVDTLEKTKIKSARKQTTKDQTTFLVGATTDVFDLPKPFKTSKKIKIATQDMLKNLERGDIPDLFFKTTKPGKKTATIKESLGGVKTKVADILSFDKKLAHGLFTKTDIFVEAGISRAKRKTIPKPKKTIKITDTDIRKLSESSGIKLSAKHKAIQQQLIRTTPKAIASAKAVTKQLTKSSAGLKQLTKSVGKGIIKSDFKISPMKLTGFRSIVTPITTTAITTIPSTKLDTSAKSLIKVRQKDKDLENSLLGISYKPITKQLQVPKERVAQFPRINLRSPLVQPQVPQLTQLTATTTFTTPEFPFPKVPPPKVSLIPFFPIIKRKRFPQQKVDKRPYNVFIKGKKIAKNLSKSNAKNFGSYVVDNSIAAQFKIKPTKGKIQQPKIKVPPVFFDMNVSKFRSPRGRKPKRNIYIERKNRRLDTANEVNQITAARFVSSQRKLASAGKLNIFGKI